jgi:hypothetical protein
VIFSSDRIVGYLSTDAVDGIWRRFARTLSRFPARARRPTR